MGLGISKIRAGALSALLMLSAAGCKKSAPVLKPLPYDYVAQKVINNIDAIRHKTVSVIENPDYVLLGRDTVALNKDFLLHPEKFLVEQNKKLSKKFMDQVKGEWKSDYISTPDGGAYIFAPDYYYKYVDKTTAVRSNNIYTTDSTDMFIPVEYYGKINPEAKPFLGKQESSFFDPLRNLLKKIGFDRNNKQTKN